MDLGGGGGGGGAAPTSQTVTNTNIPEYAQPYMETLLGKAQALTNTPYQTYGGARQAGETALQKQAATGVGGLDAGPGGFSAGVQQYMSPYMQNVVDIQKREAQRQSDIQGLGQQAKATQAGAFGGYRDAIERSERERNLGQQMNDIQAKGSQAAFDQASNQFRQGIGQQMDVGKLQNALGTQQQQSEQNRLAQQYQDFLNQQNNPYKQIGFMSDILRGIPGTSSASSIYQAPPSGLSQVAGLGTLAAGLLKAEGGIIRETEGYADGGAVSGVPDDQQLRSMLSQLSDAQLQQVAKLGKYDPQAIQQEMQRRALMRSSGLASVPQAETGYADGGIVAFADGGQTEDEYGYLPGESIMEHARRNWDKIGSGVGKGVQAVADFLRVDKPKKYADETSRGSRADLLRANTEAQPDVQTAAPAAAPSAAGAPTPTSATGTTTQAPQVPSGGIASIASGKSSKTKTSGTQGRSDMKIEEPAFKATPYEDMASAVSQGADKYKSSMDADYAPFKQLLSDERAALSAKKDENVKNALIRAGLGMIASRSPYGIQGIGEGATQGFDAYQAAQKADAEALKANTHSQMLLMQAQRAERSGDLNRATQLYAQARAEKATEAQLTQKSQELKNTRDYQQRHLDILQQQANQQGEYQRGRVGTTGTNKDLATLKAQQANIVAQMKANPMLQYTDPAAYASLVNSLQEINDAMANQPGGVTMSATAAPSTAGWGKPVVKN